MAAESSLRSIVLLMTANAVAYFDLLRGAHLVRAFAGGKVVEVVAQTSYAAYG